ncbi:hypothetical protein GOP47_0006978 [Adiantum capillus-veneris]|uniref:Uncharacterized protein n=1 Tax=Adiantum capillus-veneris TaxID=13818 RepID=A0A9D4ZIV7_ADICA|nr:hypothetical protein GOP47_0006978 [Adiantum capillus-veneris]
MAAASLKQFLLEALRHDQRLDGRGPFDFRSLTINCSREDGAAEVQLGQTRISCVVTCQLVQPYSDQPNEGSLVVYTEFSPMADPYFEVGRPGENAVELGRVIERGLRDSRAIDTESLCVLSGKAVWSLRVEIHVLDNGGNLIDAACVAALAALLSFRRPECSLAGAEGQDVVIYPPEVCEPVPLIIHYLPIAFTFGFFGDGELMVMDPSFKEELLMRGRLTIILDINGDICAIQKAGGVGVSSCDILHCLRIASTKVAEVTSSLRKAVEAHELEKAHLKTTRQLDFLEIKAATIMQSAPEGCGVMREDEDDAVASSDESSNSSTSEEVIDILHSNRLRVKQEGKRGGSKCKHQQFAKGPLVAPLSASQTSCRKEIHDLSSDLITTNRAGEVRGSAFGNIDHRQQVSESERGNNLVSHELEGLSIQMSGEVKMAERGHASSLKGKPQSLLDAVKWENVKGKKAGSMRA